jgi:Zn-dependent metalloprotease
MPNIRQSWQQSKSMLAWLMLVGLFFFFASTVLTAQVQRTKSQQERVVQPTHLFYEPRGNNGSEAVLQGTAGRLSLPAHANTPLYGRSTKNRAVLPTNRTITGRAEYAADGTLLRFSGSLGKLTSTVKEALHTSFIKRTTAMLEGEEQQQRAYTSAPVVQEVLRLLESSQLLTQLQNPREELSIISASRDELGFQHLRFEQRYKGLRVHGRDLYVHANAHNDVYLVNGEYVPTPNMSIEPSVTKEVALQATNEALRRTGEWGEIPKHLAEQLGYNGPVTELLLYPYRNRLRLAYSVLVCPNVMQSWLYFVDALTGDVLGRTQLHRYDNIYEGIAASNSQSASHKNPRQVSPTAQIAAQNSVTQNTVPSIMDSKIPREGAIQTTGFVNVTGGQDLLRRTVTVRGWRGADGTIFPLSDEGNFRETPADRLPRQPNGGHIVLDADGTPADVLGDRELTLRTTSANQPFTPQITSALSTSDSVLRYFRLRFNRTSWDNRGTFIQTIINIRTSGPGDAWWNPTLIAQGYGPGDPAEGGPGWRDLHLIGHEIGHAYNSVARLDYSNDQGGAIEEHYANFWGWMVTNGYYVFPELWGTNPRENSNALHMSGEPDSSGEANRNRPRTMADFRERTDPRVAGQQFPHYNGPIVDRAGWFFVQQYGNDTTSRIWERALGNYLTQQTRFGSFRTALVQAATDLYPNNAQVVSALNAAFDRVGITPQTGLDAPSQKVFAGERVSEVQSARSTIAFTTQSGRIGVYDVTSRRATLFTGNDVVVRTQGGRSQLSAPRGGRRLYFVNTQGRLAFLDLATSRVSVFPTLQIRQVGDILSAAISPDERRVAMTSQYDNDAAIYVAAITGTTAASPVQRIALERLVTSATVGTRKAEGKQIAGIRFPDALAWSPDAANPELILDAMSSLRAGRDTITFWALYTVGLPNRQAPAVSEVYTPQPEFNLGFPTFSSLNPNTIAFGDTFDDTTDIYVANFDQAQDRGYLNLRQFTLGGRGVVDADQASFSPDDRQIVMVSGSRPRSLLVYSFAQGSTRESLQEITFDSTVTRPYWAGLDFTTSIATQGTNVFGLQASPNPAQTQTTVRFSLTAPSRVSLRLYDMQGREVLRLLDGMQPEGAYALPIETAELASGVYMCKLQTGTEHSITRIVITR